MALWDEVDKGHDNIRPLRPQSNMWQQAAKASSEYDKLAFVTRATDNRGHGVRITAQVPPEMYTLIMQFVAESEFPDYRMPADFIRDACHHWLHERGEELGSTELRETVRDYIHEMSLTEKMIRTKERMERWANLTKILDETAAILYKNKAWNQLTTILDQFEEDNEATPEPFLTLVLDGIAKWRAKLAAREDS